MTLNKMRANPSQLGLRHHTSFSTITHSYNNNKVGSQSLLGYPLVIDKCFYIEKGHLLMKTR